MESFAPLAVSIEPQLEYWSAGVVGYCVLDPTLQYSYTPILQHSIAKKGF